MSETIPDTELYAKIFKQLLWDRATDAAIVSLFAAQPWMNIWPIAPIIKAIIRKISENLYEKIYLFVDMTEIRLANHAHEIAYKEVSLKLAVIAHDKGIESNEFKIAREAAKKSLSVFVRFNG